MCCACIAAKPPARKFFGFSQFSGRLLPQWLLHLIDDLAGHVRDAHVIGFIGDSCPELLDFLQSYLSRAVIQVENAILDGPGVQKYPTSRLSCLHMARTLTSHEQIPYSHCFKA